MGIRLPLTPLSQQFHEVVREAMRQATSRRERLRVVEGKADDAVRLRPSVAAVLGLTLAGCGTLFDSAKVDYKSEKKLPPLEVPPDLTTPARDERYQIPKGARPGRRLFRPTSRAQRRTAARIDRDPA